MWSRDGLDVGETNDTHTVCYLSHLSVFSVIMNVREKVSKMFYWIPMAPNSKVLVCRAQLFEARLEQNFPDNFLPNMRRRNAQTVTMMQI